MSLVLCSVKLSLGVLKPRAKHTKTLVIALCLCLATYFQYYHYYTGKYFPFKCARLLFVYMSFYYILKSECSLQRNPSPTEQFKSMKKNGIHCVETHFIPLAANICATSPPPIHSRPFGMEGHLQLLSVTLTDSREILSLAPERKIVWGGDQSSRYFKCSHIPPTQAHESLRLSARSRDRTGSASASK